MGSVSEFVQNMDWWGLIALLLTAVAALLCITVHELCHGLAAYRLGDPTAKNAGRLTLNPLRHLDFLGLIMMLVVKVGWAKPVPIDMRNFRNPKRGMALTALAGPASNFLISLVSVGICSAIFHFAVVSKVSLLLLSFFANLALLGTGMGLFNFIPISPLDGSKVLLSLLPDRACYTVLRYERFVMGALIVLTLLGVFQRPLSFLMVHVLNAFCTVTGMPLVNLLWALDVTEILRML